MKHHKPLPTSASKCPEEMEYENPPKSFARFRFPTKKISLWLLLLANSLIYAQADCYNGALPAVREFYNNGEIAKAKEYITEMETLCEGTPTYAFRQLKEEIYGNQNTDEPDTSFASFTETVSGISFKMVAIQGGSFKMGSNDGDSFEQPVHQVNIPHFYMGETEVTYTQFKTFIEASSYVTDAEKNGYSWVYDEEWKKKEGIDWRYNSSQELIGGNSQHPVVHISWNDAQAYCRWLSKKTGKRYRLPSESEWEYAARGGNKSRGYKYAGSNSIGDVAWYDDNSGGKIHSVAQKQSNELGLYDMSGNVWEWCKDKWHSNYTGAPTNGSAWTSGSPSYPVLRGGSWVDYAKDCRSAFRFAGSPDSSYIYFGFRLALSTGQ